MVYGVCVMVVNCVLLKMTNSYMFYAELMIVIQAGAFWIVLWLESGTSFFPQVYGLWEEFISMPAALLGIFLVLSTVFTLDQIFSLKKLTKNEEIKETVSESDHHEIHS